MKNIARFIEILDYFLVELEPLGSINFDIQNLILTEVVKLKFDYRSNER